MFQSDPSVNITDCTEWSDNSATPFEQQNKNLSAVTRIELGPINDLKPQIRPSSVFAVSASVSQKADVNLVQASNIHNISVFLSASDGHSIHFLQRNKMKQLRHLDTLCEQAREQQLTVRCYLMCAFSCPFEGKISPHELAELCAKLIRFGCEDVILVDNQGVAENKDLEALLNVLSPQLPKTRTGFYFSADNPETSSMIQVAQEYGINKFCASRNRCILIGSETQSSVEISDLLIY